MHRTPPKSPPKADIQGKPHTITDPVTSIISNPPGQITLRNKPARANKRQCVEDSPKSPTSPTKQCSCACGDLKTELLSMLLSWKAEQDERLSQWKADQDALLKSLVKDVSELKQNYSEIQKKTIELDKGMTFINKDYEDIKSRVLVMESLEMDTKVSLSKYEKEIQDLRMQSRPASIELRNVPIKENENIVDLVSILTNIGKAVKLEISKTGLRDVYRLPGKPGNPRPIVAEFISVSQRNDLLSSIKTYNKNRQVSDKINSQLIGLPGEKFPIYVAEYQTPADDLHATIQSLKPDILALNETWLQEGAEKYAPSVSGYFLKHRARPGNRPGGGVGFYVRRGIRVNVRPHPDSTLEQLWLEVTLPGYKVAVGTAYRRIKISKAPTPWITEVIKIMMLHRDEALVRAHKTKTPSHMDYYRQLKNLVTSSVRNERKAYFTYYVNNNAKKPKEMWKHLKSTSTFSDPCEPFIPNDLNNPDEINKFFLDLPGNEEPDLETLNYFKNTVINKNQFDLEKTTCKEVLDILNSIKTKAYGHDLINSEMIQLTLPTALHTIVAIINKSIETKVFPDSWKIALVKPIPKTKNINELKDLRPISILPVLSKVIERVIEKQLTLYVEANNILPQHQSGFRAGHGTATALAHVTNDILSESDAGRCSMLVLLDFSRAFDCLNRELLLAKLTHYGISSDTCKWFRSYLTNRYQQVVTEDDKGNIMKSESMLVERGVPQGSIMSPILFIIFTADLPGTLQHSKVHMYADDTQIYKSFKPMETRQAIVDISKEVEQVLNWSQKNTLVLNASKTKYMFLGTRSQIKAAVNMCDPLLVNGVVLERVKVARNLGLIMDEELRFAEHINGRIQNAFYRLKVLYGIPHENASFIFQEPRQATNIRGVMWIPWNERRTSEERTGRGDEELCGERKEAFVR
uniref:Reverse transcriptase domain-containing protein n=1 Tax=Heliothis virescens TaxID=7102 RepID=A0A2A4K4N4_HELVI